jgi:predicted Zn-dependent protease
MGRQFAFMVSEHFELLDDDFAVGYFNALGRHLVKQVETRHFPYHFYVIKHPMLNAFAGPGGRIFFFSGLINSMERVDELAAVLSHEIAHVSARHLAERVEQASKMTKASMAAILGGILLGGPAGGALVTGSMAAGQQAMLNYSRNDERQADQLGFKYAAAGGFNPEGMIGVLEKIQKGGHTASDRIPSYLLTHPTGPERMTNIDSLLREHTDIRRTEETRFFMDLFPYFRTVVRAKCLDPAEAEKLFHSDLAELELKEESGSALPYFGLGIVNKEMMEYDQSIAYFRRALEEEPEFYPILTHLGESYQMSGRDRKAIEVFQRALRMNEKDLSTIFLLGVSYENLEQYDEAIRIFQKLAYQKYVKKEVFYHLGLVYGRTNRLALAHYNFGIFHMRSGSRKEAAFHLKKAEGLAGYDGILREKIQRALEELGE